MRKHLKFIVLCLVAVVLLVWLARGLDWTKVRAALGQANKGLILLAALVVWATYLMRALRWRELLAPLTAPAKAKLSALFAATTVGYAALFIIGRAGEIVRPAFLPLRDSRVKPSASLVTIAVERLYDMTAVVLLFAINLLMFDQMAAQRNLSVQQIAEFAGIRKAGMLLVVAVVVGIFCLVLFRKFSQPVIAWAHRVNERLPRVLQKIGSVALHLLEQLAEALGVLTSARELATTVGWTIILWGAITLATRLVLAAFGGDFGWRESIFVLGFSMIGSLVPTPGGAAGTFHAATAWALQFLGTEKELSFAIAIILHLVFFGPAVVFGAYYFFRSDISFARLRQVVASERTLEDKTITASHVEAT